SSRIPWMASSNVLKIPAKVTSGQNSFSALCKSSMAEVSLSTITARSIRGEIKDYASLRGAKNENCGERATKQSPHITHYVFGDCFEKLRRCTRCFLAMTSVAKSE